MLRLRGQIPRETKWDVVVDLYFYRDPEEAEKEEQAAKEAAPPPKAVEVSVFLINRTLNSTFRPPYLCSILIAYESYKVVYYCVIFRLPSTIISPWTTGVTPRPGPKKYRRRLLPELCRLPLRRPCRPLPPTQQPTTGLMMYQRTG